MTAIVTRTLSADHVTPVRAYAALRAQSPGRSSFLLESAAPGERGGQYSILGYRAKTESLYPGGFDPFASLKQDLDEIEAVEGLAAGLTQALVGFIGYDAAHRVHDVDPWPNEDYLGRMMRGATVVVFDHAAHTLTIAGTSQGAVNRCAWEMTHGPELAAMPLPDPEAMPADVEATMSDDAYAVKVARAKQHIAAGRAAHVVLARTFRAPLLGADPFDVYRALRVLTPAPYLFFLDFAESPFAPGLTLAGASPEALVRVEARRVTVRPFAGAHGRGGDEAEDRAIEDELRARHEAEHEVRMGLAQGELGRACAEGSVERTEAASVQRRARGMHLVGEVRGVLREGASPLDVVREAFPSATFTGAPKAKATAIIRELEAGPRRMFGGAVGYIAPHGQVAFAHAHQTIWVRYGNFEVMGGAGVGAESVAEDQAAETRRGAQSALAAIRAAHDAAREREAAAERKAAAEKAAAEKAAAEKEAAEQAAAAPGAGEQAAAAPDAGEQADEGGGAPKAG